MFFQENGQYRCAVYLRLSRSDGDQQESNSIKNQRALLNDYLGKHPELHKVDEYVDDGYSGTNFERPDFKRMIQDIENRKINCIIVKDLSRFGRNYIETGRYLERIFPFMGVRFIAINDHYDSAEENDDKGRILIPFNNLINDTYCRDISMRVRSHLDVKRKEGQFIGSFAGYGYQKDPKDKNHLIIDEYAAGIVQEIFKQKLNGMSSQRIASHLNELGVLPPNEYKRANGFNYTCGFQAGLNQKWTVVSVNRILKNESYTGTLIQGKRRKINYKVKRAMMLEVKTGFGWKMRMMPLSAKASSASTTVVGTGHSYRTIADNSLSIIRFSALCRLRAEYDSPHGDEKREEVSILSLLYL